MLGSQYINLDKELTKMKRDYNENYEKEIHEKEDLSKSMKNTKNSKIKIVIDEKNNNTEEKASLAVPKAIINVEGFDFEYLNTKNCEDYSRHFHGVKDNLVKIFKINEQLTISKGINPKILKVSQGSIVVGFLSYYYDFASNSALKIVINHISTTLKESGEIEQFLLTMKTFFMQHVQFDEAFVNLYYHENQGNFVIDQEIVDIFKKKLLFKWYKLENTGTQRIMILNLKNPAENPLKSKYLNENVFCLKMKYSMTYSLKKNVQVTDECKDVNLFPMIVSLLSLEGEGGKGYSVEKRGVFNQEKENMKKISRNFLSSIQDEKDIVFENLKKNGVDINTRNHESHKKLFSSLFSMRLKFENIISSKVKVDKTMYYFNLLTVEKVDIMINKENSQIYYLVRIDDNNTMMITDASKMKVKDSICEDFYKTFSKLEAHEKETKTKILLPCFTKKVQNYYRAPQISNQIQIKKGEEAAMVTDLSEYNEISFGYDKELDKTIKIEEMKDCIMIKDDFIFGIINFEVAEAQIPAVYTTKISKSDWQHI